MLFQVLCGFEPVFYTTHPNEEPKMYEFSKKNNVMYDEEIYNQFLTEIK